MWTKRIWVLMASSVACLALSVDACDERLGGTMAEDGAPVGDVSSCYRGQSPTDEGPAVICTRPISDCIADGCSIQLTDVRLYPDGSWGTPDAQPGTWELVPDPAPYAQGPLLLLDGAPWGWVGDVD